MILLTGGKGEGREGEGGRGTEEGMYGRGR